MQNSRQMGRHSVNHMGEEEEYRYTAVEVRSLAGGRQPGCNEIRSTHNTSADV